MSDLGRILKACRKFNRMTQGELGEKLKLARSYISQIESGKKVPTLKVLQSYSQVFDIELSALFFFSENQSSDKLNKIRSFFRKKAIDFLEFLQK